MAQNGRVYPVGTAEEEAAGSYDPSLGSLPTLVVPDDPLNGAIERPMTPVEMPMVYDASGTEYGVMSAESTAPGGYDATGMAQQPIYATELAGGAALPRVSLSSAGPLFPSVSASASPAAAAVSPRAAAIDSTDYRAMAKRASALAKMDRLAGGHKSVFDANMADIGALGVGMQLYFMLTKYLGTTFFIMGILSLPAIAMHLYGNGVTDSMADPLKLSYASLGNEGVNPDIQSDTTLCLPKGDIDCNWTTVSTPVTSSPGTVSWIITISDVVYSVFFLLFLVVYRAHAKSAIENYQNENLTPAKYAVQVRGLPLDATEAEIIQHFDALYDLTKDEEYNPNFLGCCWGRRRKVKMSLSRNATNRSTVQNLDHLAATTHATKDLYLNTWIAEVSIGHPTGGLLRTFLSMQALTKQIADMNELISILQLEQDNAEKNPQKYFRKRDELLLQTSKKKLEKLNTQMQHKVSKIKALKQQSHEHEAQQQAQAAASAPQDAKSKLAAASKAAKKAAIATQHSLNWEACECAFVVFNNVESRRRCLHDYRRSTKRLARFFQPKVLRFRNGKYPLIVVPAPEPSNILWENLEVTDRGRFYRRSFTNLLTFLLLLLSCVIISGAQSAQQVMKSKLVSSDFCDWTLPLVYYGNISFASKPSISWKLEWNSKKTCADNAQGDTQYYIAYTNKIVNSLSKSIQHPARTTAGTVAPQRCVEACVAETSNRTCSTMPCFDQDLLDAGEKCTTYPEANVLYCLCKEAISDSISEYGPFTGAKRLWTEYVPCRSFIRDYVARNVFMYLAAGIVVIVNIMLKSILRQMATFERHSSESAKASAIAMKLFMAQFLNTAVIVLVVNAALGLNNVPVLKDLFKGTYADFERNWYPTVGMGITMTMLINVFVPQVLLLLQMVVISPLQRCYTRCKIRTQEKMNDLYAGPTFDISIRYPLVLNSVFVCMAFSGGSPVLLFIAALTAAGTYWFDKLSIIYLYSVRTAYDEALGETALDLLPWTLVLHLAFSMWMYGNTDLMKSSTVQLDSLLKFFNVEIVDSNGTVMDANALYAEFLKRIATFDVLGKHGFAAKIINTNVMIIFLFLVIVLLGMLFSTLLTHLVLPVLRRTLGIVIGWLYRKLARGCLRCRRHCCKRSRKVHAEPTPAAGGDPSAPAPPPLISQPSMFMDRPAVVIPEYTDYFRKTVSKHFRPDTQLGFVKNPQGELVRLWKEETVQHGIKRVAGEPMRTWEAMQAPVKSYAIEANSKYRLAVAEIEIAIRASSFHVVKAMAADTSDHAAQAVDAALLGTEPVNITVQQGFTAATDVNGMPSYMSDPIAMPSYMAAPDSMGMAMPGYMVAPNMMAMPSFTVDPIAMAMQIPSGSVDANATTTDAATTEIPPDTVEATDNYVPQDGDAAVNISMGSA